jgi:type I restriction enzyme S subunit
LSEIADLCLGKMLDRKKNKGSFRPYLANINVRWGSLDLQDLREMPFEDRELERYGLRLGDIVMCEGGEPGRCVIWKDQVPGMMIQKALHRIRPRAEVDGQFLYYKLFHKGRSGGLDQYFTGATIKHLPGEQLAKVEVCLPPLPTQRRIASILGAYDHLIEVNRRRIAVLEEMARGLFEEWFVRFRFPGHEAVPMLDTPNGPLPEGWMWGVFGDLAREVRQTVSPADVPPDTPYVGLEHMPRRSFTLDQHGRAEEVSSLKSHFQRGDILFGKIRPYFHKVIWAGFDGVSSTDAIVWRPIAGFAAQALATASSDAFVAYSVQTSNGTKMPRANARVLADYRCALAPSDIAGRFENTVGAMVELCATLQAECHRLAASRDLLLPRLISGQLSVAEAERELDEVA